MYIYGGTFQNFLGASETLRMMIKALEQKMSTESPSYRLLQVTMTDFNIYLDVGLSHLTQLAP